jgi:hypothetical protein
MKLLLPLFGVTLLLQVATFAQLPVSSVIPDFSATDLNGQNHHLYSILNADKIAVVVFVSAQNSESWDYHTADNCLSQLQSVHGPGGDNRLRVLQIESDPLTNLACLTGQPGCVSNVSFGDWRANINYPLINDLNGSIAALFPDVTFPCVYVIGPNRRGYKVGTLSAVALWEFAQRCPIAAGANNPALYDFDTGTSNYQRELCSNQNIKPSVKLTNVGAAELTNVRVNLRRNDSVLQTIEWSGSLLTYEDTTLIFDDFDLGTEGTVAVEIDPQTAIGDANLANNAHEVVFQTARQTAEQIVRVWVRTDDYGAETYWQITDQAGNLISSAGNSAVGTYGHSNVLAAINPSPNAFPSNHTAKKNVLLPSTGCYDFTLMDAFGDGICCVQGMGWYKILSENYTNNNDTLVSGGEFRGIVTRSIVIGIVGADAPHDLAAYRLLVAPNPVHDWLHLQLSAPPNTVLRRAFVSDALGRQVLDFDPTVLAYEGQWSHSVAGWPTGYYRICLETEAGVLAQHFVILGQ